MIQKAILPSCYLVQVPSLFPSHHTTLNSLFKVSLSNVRDKVMQRMKDYKTINDYEQPPEKISEQQHQKIAK